MTVAPFRTLWDPKISRSARDLIALGVVKGWTNVHKFGHNDNLGSVVEDVWNAGGVYTYLTAAALMEVVSTSANDTAAGSGCRSVVVQGLDADFAEQSETVVTDGTAAVVTVNSYIRINRMYCLGSGTYGGGSAGDITIRVASGGATQAKIAYTSDGAALDFGQTQVGRYCIPAGKVAFMTSVEIGIESGKGADVLIYQRQGADVVAAPFTSRRLVKSIDGLNGDVTVVFDGPLVFPEKTDIIVRARLTSGANGRVHISYDLFLGDA
jgi:hypothetical protein